MLDLGTQLARYFGVDQGVLVASVRDGSVAAAAGLQAGDVITSVGTSIVGSVDRLRRHIADVDSGTPFDIGVVREGNEQTLQGQFEARRRRVVVRPRTV